MNRSLEPDLDILTVAPETKLLPFMVNTALWEVFEIELGVTLVTEGAGPRTTRPEARVALCPSGLVTVTSQAPVVTPEG